MKKLSGIFLTALTAALMTACNEVPEDVKSRAEAQKSPSDSVVTDGQGREKIKNITFDCAPDPYDPDKVYLLKVDRGMEYDENKDYSGLVNKVITMGKDVFGLDLKASDVEVARDKDLPVWDLKTGKIDPDKKNIVTDPDAVYFDDLISVEFHESGEGFSLYNSTGLTGTLYDGYFYRDIYYPWSYPEDRLVMNDSSTMTIKEAVDQGEELLNKLRNIGVFDERKEITLGKIAVKHGDGDGVIIALYYTESFDGVRFCEDGILAVNNNGARMLPSELVIEFNGSGKIFKSHSRYNFKPVEQPEKVDIMTFADAKKRLADGLAPNLTFTVRESQLVYSPIAKENGVEEYHPMWEFVLDDPSRKRMYFSVNDNMGNNPYRSTAMDFPKKTALVDALNGDIYYIDPFQNLSEVYSNTQ